MEHESFRSRSERLPAFAVRRFSIRPQVAAELVESVLARYLSGKYDPADETAWLSKAGVRERLDASSGSDESEEGIAMTNHLPQDVLILAARGERIDSAEEVHLRACSACGGEVREFRETEEMLRDSRTWEGTGEASPGEERLALVMRFAGLLQAEDGAARDLVGRLLPDGGVAALREAVEADPEVHRAGLVRELIERSENARDRNPSEALELVLLGCEVSRRLPGDLYPKGTVTHLQGLAEKESANALRVLGRYADAFAALDRAEPLLARGAAAGYDLAIAAYARGLLCAATDRPDEALRLAARSAAELREYGDVRRVAHARMLEAMLRAGRGETGKAREILEALLEPLRQCEDWPTLAALSGNLANLAIDEGKLDEATSHLEAAEESARKAGNFVDLARGGWQLGVVLIHAGRSDEGIRRLEQARTSFVELSMPGEVAALSLELVDALLGAGRPARAEELCRTLPEECGRLGMPRNALLALAYLKECGAAGKLTAKATDHVREYLGRVRREPALQFLPLPT